MTLPVQTPEPGSRLARRYATVGRLELALDETLAPVVIVDDVRDTGEALAGVARVVAIRSATLSVTPVIEFRLPDTGSAVVIVTERIHLALAVSGGPAEVFFIRFGPAGAVAGLNNAFLVASDGRKDWRDFQNVGAQIGSFPPGGAAGRVPTIDAFAGESGALGTEVGGPNYAISVLAQTTFTLPLAVTMVAGSSIYVDAALNNAGDLFQATLEFREEPRRA